MNKKQMSESLLLITFITISGALQDAYTYFARGKVFANAQTGNIVLMAAHFFDGDFIGGVRYLIPFLSFALGVFIAEQIEGKYKNAQKVHWRQMIIVVEILILGFTAFLPESCNLIANSLISLACAMQVQSFRKWHGVAYASTMCIGNLRSGIANLSAYLRTKNKKTEENALYYFGVIFTFFIGAGIGVLLVNRFGLKAILGSCIALIISYFLMNATD